MKLRTVANYKHDPKRVEANDQTLVTKPDMAFTPKDLLIRQSKGLTLPGLKNHFYAGDIEYPDFSKMDLTERDEWEAKTKMEYRKQYDKMQAKEQAQRAERQKRAQAWQDFQKHMEADKTPPKQ